MNDHEDFDQTYDGPSYRPSQEIGVSELRSALAQLQLFGDDPYLRMQAFNLATVDQFVMGLETDVLRSCMSRKRRQFLKRDFYWRFRRCGSLQPMNSLGLGDSVPKT